MLFTATTGDLPAAGARRQARAALTSHHRDHVSLQQADYIDEQRTHLFAIPATGGEVRQITDGDWDDEQAAWSPDGQQIVFVSDRRDDRWYLPRMECG